MKWKESEKKEMVKAFLEALRELMDEKGLKGNLDNIKFDFGTFHFEITRKVKE